MRMVAVLGSGFMVVEEGPIQDESYGKMAQRVEEELVRQGSQLFVYNKLTGKK